MATLGRPRSITTSHTVVLDNGNGALKIGLSSALQPKCMPNAIMRARRARGNIIGAQLDDCVDAAGLTYRRAFEKG